MQVLAASTWFYEAVIVVVLNLITFRLADGLVTWPSIWWRHRQADDAGSCHGDFASTDLLKNLQDSLKLGKGEAMKQALFQQSQPVIMTISTRHVACMHDSFLVNAHAALEEPTTIMAVNLDQESLDRCLAHPLASNASQKTSKKERATSVLCVNLVDWLPQEIVRTGPDGKVDNIGFGSCGYHVLVWSKPVLLKYAVKHSKHGVLLMDSDIVLHGSILKWVSANRRPGAAIVTEQWLGKPWPSTGVVYADGNSSALLKAWVEHCTADQYFVGDTEELRDLFVASNKFHIQFIPNDILGECAREAEVATHYNCVSKIETMERHGVWLPHDSECK